MAGVGAGGTMPGGSAGSVCRLRSANGSGKGSGDGATSRHRSEPSFAAHSVAVVVRGRKSLRLRRRPDMGDPFRRSPGEQAAGAAREPDTQAALDLAALRFLERSRDVASEMVIDCARAQTST